MGSEEVFEVDERCSERFWESLEAIVLKERVRERTLSSEFEGRGRKAVGVDKACLRSSYSMNCRQYKVGSRSAS